jgi:hypothetical protein
LMFQLSTWRSQSLQNDLRCPGCVIMDPLKIQQSNFFCDFLRHEKPFH